MYLRPGTLGEACAALAVRPFHILSGGTDFYPSLSDRPTPDAILDLSNVSELDGIAQSETEIRIGARTTWSRIAGAELPPGLDALRAAAREVGSVQIQNVATIGGNLCNASPAADGVPPLLAVDAAVELHGRGGVRRLPVGDFLCGNRRTARRDDEILSAVVVPRERAGGRSAFVKLGSRRYLVISIVMAAARIETDDRGRVSGASVAVGACSAAAVRLPELEAELIGLPARPGLGARVVAPHLARLTPIDDVRATASFRNEAARVLVGRALDSCVAED